MSAGDPFVAGDFCCPSTACVLIKTSHGWKKFPHITEVSYNKQAAQNGLITSDTNGEEQAACGAVNTTGTLSYACHDGNQPGILDVNTNYQIRWAQDCDSIWTGSAPVGTPTAGTYYEAIIKITGIPYNLPISQAGAMTFQYQWKLVSWIASPSVQASVTD